MHRHAARQPEACGLLVFAIVDLPLALLQLSQSLLVVEYFGGSAEGRSQRPFAQEARKRYERCGDWRQSGKRGATGSKRAAAIKRATAFPGSHVQRPADAGLQCGNGRSGKRRDAFHDLPDGRRKLADRRRDRNADSAGRAVDSGTERAERPERAEAANAGTVKPGAGCDPTPVDATAAAASSI